VAKLDQKIIDWAIEQWSPCLRKCFPGGGGGHFGHQLYPDINEAAMLKTFSDAFKC